MRISSIQNFALNNLNKCCKPRKSNENNVMQNNALKFSPIQDTVCFGRFDERYTNPSKKPYIPDDIYNYLHDFEACNIIEKSPFYTVSPTDATKRNPGLKAYEAAILDEETDDIIISSPGCKPYVDETVRRFNVLFDLKDGWHKNLNSEEDFAYLAALNGALAKAEVGARETLLKRYNANRLAEMNRIAGIGLPEADDDDEMDIFDLYDKGFSL